MQVVRDWDCIKLPELLGRDHVFVSVHEAMQHALVGMGATQSMLMPICV